jgi:hypothetical protein
LKLDFGLHSSHENFPKRAFSTQTGKLAEKALLGKITLRTQANNGSKLGSSVWDWGVAAAW